VKDLMARRTAFRKSSYSSAGNCVEVGSPTSRLFAVRDTKDIGGPWVSFSVAGWREFVGQIKADVVVTPGLLLGCGGSAKGWQRLSIGGLRAFRRSSVWDLPAQRMLPSPSCPNSVHPI
jgi:hypothetical protein